MWVKSFHLIKLALFGIDILFLILDANILYSSHSDNSEVILSLDAENLDLDPYLSFG